mmetsp:Transcript_106972/g.300880  ORF Transcript_106972/g.300880 Transcript_106972/m.300880 type:complete len:204 (+) Transcript_106972:98-709(+)
MVPLSKFWLTRGHLERWMQVWVRPWPGKCGRTNLLWSMLAGWCWGRRSKHGTEENTPRKPQIHSNAHSCRNASKHPAQNLKWSSVRGAFRITCVRCHRCHRHDSTWERQGRIGRVRTCSPPRLEDERCEAQESEPRADCKQTQHVPNPLSLGTLTKTAGGFPDGFPTDIAQGCWCHIHSNRSKSLHREGRLGDHSPRDEWKQH